MQKKIYFSFLFFCCFFGANAQNQTLTLKLYQASFEELVQQIEKQTDFRIYYDQSVTDSIQLTVDISQTAIKSALEQVLHPLELYVTFVPDNRIFITDKQALITDLSGLRFKDDHIVTSQQHSMMTHLVDYTADTLERVIAIENRLFEVGNKGQSSRNMLLNGYVRDASTGSPLPLTTVELVGHPQVVMTDQQGYFSITVPEERVTVKFSNVGKKETQRQLLMHSSGRLDIEMENRIYALDEVVVTGAGGTGVTRTQMGIERLSIATIRQTPTVFGEADVIRVVLTLPGVQSVSEGSGGFNVRGGSTDQNLVLFNDATIYNPSHFFGFFSAFNPDAVSSIELYKSSMPARFGGRLSSVLDVTAKEGNRNDFSGSGGIGLLTGRLTLEGPLSKKTSFLIGGRSTYSDWLMKYIPDESYKNSSASFYDGNLQLIHDLNDKNSLYLVGYMSHDQFGLSPDTSYSYQNRSVNLKWKSIMNDNWNSVVTVGMDSYGFNMRDTYRDETAYDLNYGNQQFFGKVDLNHTLNERHRLLYGLSSIYYDINPGSMLPRGSISTVVENLMQTEQALESAIHVTDVFQVNENLVLDLGLRYSMFNFLGNNSKTYHAPEFRLSGRYNISSNASVKLGYNSLRQYIHMLSNTTAITPTDTWKLSDSQIKPQFGDQASIGLYQNFDSDKIETSVEVYYKRMEDYLDYKGGARLLMNPEIHADVIGTEARAYGAEFMVKKLSGRLNGWMSYTYSKVEQRTVGGDPVDMINEGAYYPSNHDKPHSVNLVGNYRFSHRFSISVNGEYSTGRPITLPIAQYDYAGTTRVFYSKRNQYRIPDYFRMDIGLNIEGNHKIRKLAHSSWTIGVYNVTGRKNPFSVYYVSEPNGIKGYKLSIFGYQIPFLTYNFKF